MANISCKKRVVSDIYCSRNIAIAPLCCSDIWKLVFPGSRFTTPTESWYSPTEGEALTVVWSLENARMCVLGCPELIVATGHKPLHGIFTNQNLSNIPNPRVCYPKEKTLCY